MDGGSGYLHDLDLSTPCGRSRWHSCHPEERSDVRICKQKYKPIHIKMADFKDEIPIFIHLFEVDKYRFCK